MTTLGSTTGVRRFDLIDMVIHSGKCFGIRSFVRDMLLVISRGAIRFHGRRSDMATAWPPLEVQ